MKQPVRREVLGKDAFTFVLVSHLPPLLLLICDKLNSFPLAKAVLPMILRLAQLVRAGC